MIIAIDGPAASGKGTIAEQLARHYGFHHLDTGSLYRAVARDILARGLKPDDVWAAVIAARILDHRSLGDPELRSRDIGEAASVVARHPEVRAALLAFQREFAHRAPGAVLDGRDIGTVVCPDADVKIYVTASLEERARRRYTELAAAEPGIMIATVTEQIAARDQRDEGRAAAPLKRASDAHLLDTTHLAIEGAVKAAVALIDQQIAVRGCP